MGLRKHFQICHWDICVAGSYVTLSKTLQISKVIAFVIKLPSSASLILFEVFIDVVCNNFLLLSVNSANLSRPNSMLISSLNLFNDANLMSAVRKIVSPCRVKRTSRQNPSCIFIDLPFGRVLNTVVVSGLRFLRIFTISRSSLGNSSSIPFFSKTTWLTYVSSIKYFHVNCSDDEYLFLGAPTI